MNNTDYTYDIALSYADEDRALVEQVVDACRPLDLRVFFDRDHRVVTWGQNYLRVLRTIYGGTAARHVVPFISKDYLSKKFPMAEYEAAMSQALKRSGDDYILPVVIGAIEVPIDLLGPHTGFLRTDEFSPQEIAEALARKVRSADPLG